MERLFSSSIHIFLKNPKIYKCSDDKLIKKFFKSYTAKKEKAWEKQIESNIYDKIYAYKEK